MRIRPLSRSVVLLSFLLLVLSVPVFAGWFSFIGDLFGGGGSGGGYTAPNCGTGSSDVNCFCDEGYQKLPKDVTTKCVNENGEYDCPVPGYWCSEIPVPSVSEPSSPNHGQFCMKWFYASNGAMICGDLRILALGTAPCQSNCNGYDYIAPAICPQGYTDGGVGNSCEPTISGDYDFNKMGSRYRSAYRSGCPSGYYAKIAERTCTCQKSANGYSTSCVTKCSTKQGQACGNCGTLDCNGNCINQATTYGQPCGNCGTYDCAGNCVNEKTTYGQACGNCGTLDCNGNCINGGVCSAGDVGIGEGCANCGTLIQTCSNNCQWSGWTCQNTKDPCTKDLKYGKFCSTTGKWLPLEGLRDEVKWVIDFSAQSKELPSECCGAMECWNGNSCVSNQAQTYAQPNYRGDYRCLDGAWKISIPKYTKDRTKIGHCPVESDCLVNPDTNSCLSTNQYMGNDLCSSGLWTTRTRAIALAMLSMVGNSPYSLYCDVPQKALTQGPIKYGSGTSPFLSPHPACVMNAGDDIMVGMGFDGMPEEGGMHTLFDGAECTSALDDGSFHSCIGAPVLFNKKLMAFIKGNSGFEVESVGIGMTTEDSLDPSILSRLKSLMAAIASKWNQLFVTQSTRAYLGDSNYNGINKTLEFDKLYMVRSNSERSIFGYYKIEGSTHHALIRYSGFSSDICDLVDEYKAANTNVFSTVGSGGATVAPGSSMIAGIGCVKENANTYAVLMQGKSTSNFNVARIGQAWEDFTVKLRVI